VRRRCIEQGDAERPKCAIHLKISCGTQWTLLEFAIPSAEVHGLGEVTKVWVQVPSYHDRNGGGLTITNPSQSSNRDITRDRGQERAKLK